MKAWLLAFLFTQLVEVPIYWRLLRCRPLTAFGASAITHPIVWFVIAPPNWPAPYLVRAITAELFAWLVEAAYFRLLGHRRALLVALGANLASVALGLGCRALFGFP
jgi:hypothetical protein